MTQQVLITGGAGFFGSVLKKRLLDLGYHCVSIDLVEDDMQHERLHSIQGDLRDDALMQRLFTEYRFACVYHLATILAHDSSNKRILWACNVEPTQQLKSLCERHGVKSLVFTSSNCLWARNFRRPVTEEDTPEPVEIYGRSKAACERILLDGAGTVNTVILRCPTIIDWGRLGLMTILFEFIREGRKVWVVGNGGNRYQFIDAGDLADACIRASSYNGSAIFNVGSDQVPTLRDVYQYVIDRANTDARIAELPRFPTVLLMRLCYRLGISPLGPYHYRMIAEDFVFDTTKIKRELGWQPTQTNQDMLWKAYQYYTGAGKDSTKHSPVSAHRKAAPMRIIRILKWLS